jgi:hypothetical protein
MLSGTAVREEGLVLRVEGFEGEEKRAGRGWHRERIDRVSASEQRNQNHELRTYRIRSCVMDARKVIAETHNRSSKLSMTIAPLSDLAQSLGRSIDSRTR